MSWVRRSRFVALAAIACTPRLQEEPGKLRGEPSSTSASSSPTGTSGTGLDDAGPQSSPGQAAPSTPDTRATAPGTSSSGAGGTSPSSDPDMTDGAEAGAGGTSGLASGGAGSNAAGSGGNSAAAGAGGTASEPTPHNVLPHNVLPLRDCNSGDGTGCEPGEVCVDVESDACTPGLGEDCVGQCSVTLPRATCEGGLAQCRGEMTCQVTPEPCPEGLVHSIVDSCWGPCVQPECCACSTELGCSSDDVVCDTSTGQCVALASPEPRCYLPVDPRSCDLNTTVFAFVDGACEEIEGGLCESGGNLFFTLDECLKRCEGLPQQGPCPEGRVPSTTCLQCGGGGGCVTEVTVCAKSCETQDDCDRGMTCVNSVCGMNFCI